jgi:hypothetical protein
MKDWIPSAPSCVLNKATTSSTKRSSAARSPSRFARWAAASVARTPKRRRPRCDPFRQLDGSVELSAGFDNLLDEADPQSLGSVEFVAGQQPAHRVAPTRLAR